MRRFLAPSIGSAICILLVLLSMRPGTAVTVGDSGSDIRFSVTDLNKSVPDAAERQRDVHPDFINIAGWISAVGAAVGSADFDGDGVYDEYCLVDPRDDSVTVGGVPGYSTFPITQLTPSTTSPAPSAPMGCVPTDLDMDGSADVIVYYWGRSPVIFYGDGGGSFNAKELVSPSQVWNTTTLTVADFDVDGQIDVMVGNYFPDGARVLDSEAAGDGRMAMQAGMANAKNAGENRLYLNNVEQGTFHDASDRLPVESAKGWTLAFGVQDLTGDMTPDIYVANDFGPDQILVNSSTPGDAQFTVATSSRGLLAPKSSNLGHDSFKGMGVTFIDLPGLDQPSIAVSNITQEFGLQESNFLFTPTPSTPTKLTEGEADYVQSSEKYNMSRSGWSWDIKAADFNNDGQDELIQATGFVQGDINRWPELQELAMGNDSLLPIPQAWLNVRPGDDLSGRSANVLWCLQESGIFKDCAPTAGIDNREPTRSYAVSDINSDGRMDAIEANQWAPSRTLINTSEVPSGFVLRPIFVDDDGTEVSAIGAKITVSSQNSQTKQLFPSNGHTGVSAAELNYGVLTEPVTIVAEWRDRDGTVHKASIPGPANSGRYDIAFDVKGEVTLRGR